MRSINLLPPEARQKAAAVRRQALWVLGGVLYLVLLGVLFFWQQGKVDNAQRDVDVAQQQVDRIQREVDELRPLAAIEEQYLESISVLAVVLDRDIAWGRILNDLARVIPDRVWIESFSGQTSTSLEEPPGQLNITGTGFDYPDISAWLRALDSVNFPGVAQAWVSSADVSSIGEADVVTFTSATFLTTDAVSTRLAERTPLVP